MKFLKKAKDLTPTHSVKYLLHKHLGAYRPARSPKNIHASDLTYEAREYCPRYFALLDVTKEKPEDQWVSTSEAMTWQIGRDQERNIVLWFAEMGKAVCDWKCVVCSRKHEFQLRPVKCEQCGCRVFDPIEVRFTSAVNNASCGVDMLLAMGQPKLRPVELKTMDKEVFKELKAPLGEHVLRTNLYLKIMSESADPNAKKVSWDEARILYVSKGGFGCADPEPKKWGLYDDFSPFKEFTITRDDSMIEEVVEKAQALTDFRRGSAGMPGPICATALTKRAGMCPMKVKCFSGQYPAGVKHDLD